ncbi:hypothetical protein BD770DRAFT_295169, partial [Pilaira anomala]
RLEQFRTQHELARNFYDDHEFCPIYHIEEHQQHQLLQQQLQNQQQNSSSAVTRAIPIINPSNMTPVSV